MVMTGTRPDLAAGLSEHRRFLVRLAALQLGSAADADDVVQDTFAAAIAGQARFSGAVPVRAWLVGILRNKIVDAIRSRSRYIALEDPEEADMGDSEFDSMFTGDGVWHPEALAGGTCPEAAMVQRQLLELVEMCVEKLPPNTARVFLMREFLDFDFADIAVELSLSEGNLRVLLYRARMRLRDCVSRGWGEVGHGC
jgi:RNA polymerase sigma-70 factor (ECF subfamily)